MMTKKKASENKGKELPAFLFAMIQICFYLPLTRVQYPSNTLQLEPPLATTNPDVNFLPAHHV